MKPYTLYTLSDPDTGLVRYVGQTCQKIATRYARHCQEARKSTRHRLYAWIKGLLNEGKAPVMRVEFEGMDKKLVDDLEIFWISMLKTTGDLLNVAVGGQDNSGWNHSEEQKQKWRENRRGEKASHFGRRHSEDTKQASSERMMRWLTENGHPLKGKSHSEDTRKKISESRKGVKSNISEEGRRRMADAQKRRWERYYSERGS